MKYFLSFFFIFIPLNLQAQKFALLDMHLAEPVRYVEKVTSNDKFNNLFPVEQKVLPAYIKALQEIEKTLASKEPVKEAKHYEMGCINFRGVIVGTASDERIDYIVTSTCDNVKITMHLCDAKLSKASNDYFVKTWIRYIESYVK
jgi:hypothetical protein